MRPDRGHPRSCAVQYISGLLDAFSEVDWLLPHGSAPAWCKRKPELRHPDAALPWSRPPGEHE